MAEHRHKTCIAILRGINVSGKNMIKMPLLVKTLEQLGLENVRSYIQSGNLVFLVKSDAVAGLADKISAEVKKDFGFDVPVFVFEATAFEKARDGNPFLGREDIDLTKLHVTFLSSVPEAEKVAAIDPGKYAPDTFILSGSVIYLYCPGGYGNTKLTNGFFENKLKRMATTRNWNTVNKLVAMASD